MNLQVTAAPGRKQTLRWGHAALILLAIAGTARGVEIEIRTSFPGGNVLVTGNEGNTVSIAPDLRGGRNWFYWYFEAEAAQPGRVTFQFPADAGAQIGVNGPAVSLDDGKSWNWLGTEQVQYQTSPRDANPVAADSFYYDFTAERPKVRFSVGIPYLQTNLDSFIAKIDDNPHLTRGVLTRSRNGRPVAIWQIGKDGPGITPVLVSARHHACEALASFVLEGFLQEAMSNSDAGQAFRQKYVLYAVPIVDVDGVEQGDQGKWRSPHDHNRDYGQPQMIYPPVIAMVELAKTKKVELALDFHCPTLRMDIHQGFYFAGISLPHIKNNMDELIAWMDEERPPAVRWGERDLLSKPGAEPPTGGMPFSNYFAYQRGIKFSATLESPFTQRNNRLDGDLARQYGRGLLRAWAKTEFIDASPNSVRKEPDSARFAAFRKGFLDLYRSKPDEAAAIANEILNQTEPAPLYRIEAHNLLGTLRFRQRKFADALRHFDVAMGDKLATARQRSLAASERVRVVCADSQASRAELDQVIEDFTGIPYPSSAQQAAVHKAAAAAYGSRDSHAKALAHAQQWFTHAGRYDQGEALNQVASSYDQLGEPAKAIAARQQAVEILRKELDPVPVGVFGPLMAADLLDALNGIPTATAAEKQAAADIALNHKIKPPTVMRRIQEGLQGTD